ncbi:hypothetical protein [Pseudodesulfovibrio sediminis]|uniref:Uncharacterized protein n=1 Tax=Pseudodesulfovibrio sediminis TaxID=2810563 RepID=A0ABN6EQC6_9BACT|nr:hypothetical protein [Pseudodesulfovibrio sediminis]BCS87380.1 hypothetical protein PSDVSF_06220 [Pseudodesulfovibrio sediminis]
MRVLVSALVVLMFLVGAAHAQLSPDAVREQLAQTEAEAIYGIKIIQAWKKEFPDRYQEEAAIINSLSSTLLEIFLLSEHGNDLLLSISLHREKGFPYVAEVVAERAFSEHILYRYRIAANHLRKHLQYLRASDTALIEVINKVFNSAIASIANCGELVDEIKTPNMSKNK